MKNIQDLDKKVLETLWLSEELKIYCSNIWFIIVPNKWDFVYKIFTDFSFYEKELSMYILLKDLDLNIPVFQWLWLIDNYNVIKLQNIRKDYKRKNNLIDLNIKQIGNIISKIHDIKKEWKTLILWDIHSSNFYEIWFWEEKKIWIFDFSSSKYWYIEEDLANIYIDLDINDDDFNSFLFNYKHSIDIMRLYNYTIHELYERIKNWMNLPLEKKKKYYTFLLKIKNKIWK